MRELPTAPHVKRFRASRPKVKTGCITCNTGRTCDGYKAKNAGLRSQNFTELKVYINPSHDINGSDREHRAFHFFRSQVVFELARVIRTPWHRLLLQICHVDEALKDAAIAIGSLGERFRINQVLTTGVHHADDCHFFAQRRYQAAVSRLQHRLNNNGPQIIDLALVCCFLFICFEFLQGNDQAVLIHLRSGLNIIKSTWTTTTAEADLTQLLEVPEGFGQLRGCILHIFTILDVQTAVWLGLRSFQLEQMLVRLDGTDSEIGPSDSFTDLEEADISLKKQINQLYRFRRAISAIDRPNSIHETSEIPERVTLERQRLMAQLAQWPSALNSLVERLRTSNAFAHQPHPFDAFTVYRIKLLTIHHRIATLVAALTLQSAQAEDHLCRQSEGTVFQEILMMADSLLQPVNVMLTPFMKSYIKTPSSDQALPFFHFLPGLIQPLYFTAVKSRSPHTQQRAIALLGTNPWREGAWDSAAMAAIASRRATEGVT